MKLTDLDSYRWSDTGMQLTEQQFGMLRYYRAVEVEMLIDELQRQLRLTEEVRDEVMKGNAALNDLIDHVHRELDLGEIMKR